MGKKQPEKLTVTLETAPELNDAQRRENFRRFVQYALGPGKGPAARESPPAGGRPAKRGD